MPEIVYLTHIFTQRFGNSKENTLEPKTFPVAFFVGNSYLFALFE